MRLQNEFHTTKALKQKSTNKAKANDNDNDNDAANKWEKKKYTKKAIGDEEKKK